MYLETFLADLAVFRRISRKYLNFTGPRPREISEAMSSVYITKTLYFLRFPSNYRVKDKQT